MKVYRVEHIETGIGPYCEEWEYREEINSAHYANSTHPTPEREVIDFSNGDEEAGGILQEEILTNGQLCGFRSLNELYSWFDGWVAKLSEAGFIIQEYQAVLHLDVFRSQVIFDPDLAKKTGQHKIKAKQLASTS